MTINTLPAAPTRTMGAAEFVTTANAFLAALPPFSSQVNADLAALLTLSQLVSTSTTSLTIGIGSKSLTVQTGKAYLANQAVRIYSTASPDNYMDGTVTSYDSGTGALVVGVTSVGGSGTLAAWTVTLNGGTALQALTLAQFAATTSAQLAGVISDETGTGALVFANSPSLTTPSVTAAMAAAHAVRADQAKSGIIAIDYSMAGNALTLIIKAGSVLQFRSTTLTAGVPVTRFIPADISLVISSGSTLGTTSAVQSDIAIIAIDNAGTVEMAAINIVGGADLSETVLISTTAEGGAGAADSASVFYSTTARTNVAYRVVGIVRSTQATAGTWVTTPALVQGAGGNVRPTSRSLVRLNTANGYGSTNTKIRRFTNIVTNIGSDITYADSAANGASFTINTYGVYAISYIETYGAAGGIGVSLNSAQLTTNVQSLPASTILTIASAAAASITTEATAQIPLSAGDVVRPHTDGSASSGALQFFTITKVS